MAVTFVLLHTTSVREFFNPTIHVFASLCARSPLVGNKVRPFGPAMLTNANLRPSARHLRHEPSQPLATPTA